MISRCLFAVFAANVPIVLLGCARPAPDGPDDPKRSLAAVPQRTPTGGEPYHGLIQYRAKDAKKAILKPELLEADEALIAPGTKVIGVFIEGQARAYPLYILNNHQIVNDQVGGIPLSATW